MQIKRFEAKDMTAALAKIKQEFGPDAVILSAKSIRTYGMLGGAKTKGVEVTAAIDPTASKPPEQPAQSRRPGDDVVTLSMTAARRQSGGRLMSSINSGLAGIKDRLGRSMPEPSPATPPPSDGRLGAHLSRQGINRMLAERCLRHIGPSPARLGDALADALRSEGVGAAGPEEQASGVMVFVGPPGVGKTTTLIKLATRTAVDDRRRVGLVTLDHKRIGAVEQMQLYADILQVPMETAFDAPSFKRSLSRLAECDAVLVDTPGIAPGDAEAVASLQKLLRAGRRRSVHLVIGACTKEEDLDRVVDGFRPLAPVALAVTKFDESVNCGSVVNVLHRSALPLSFIGDGSEIPEDLHPGSVSWLARRLLAGYSANAVPAPRPKAAPKHRQRTRATMVRPQPLDGDEQPFVANSNSDIFHRTDCKWTKMIKTENFLSFSSMEDALSQGFNPCRYCKPQPTASGKRVLTETGTAHMAGYR